MKNKTIISFLIVLTMAFSLFTPVYAVNSNDDTVISFEEFNEAVKAAYAQYNITFNCTRINEDFVYTKGLLNEKLEDIKKEISAQNYDPTTRSFVSYAIETSTTQPNIIQPNAMYVNKNFVNERWIDSPSQMGGATIRVNVNATCNVQNAQVVSINSVNSYRMGYGVNFESWVQTGQSMGINYNRDWITGDVYGTLTVSYIDPKLNIEVSYASEHSIYCGWNYK